MTVQFRKLKQSPLDIRVFSLVCPIWWWVLGSGHCTDWYALCRWSDGLLMTLGVAVGRCWQITGRW